VAFHQSHFPGVKSWGGGKDRKWGWGLSMKMEAWGLRLKWWGAEVGAIWGYRVQEEAEDKKIKQKCYSLFILPPSSEPRSPL